VIKGKKIADLGLSDLDILWDALNMYNSYGSADTPTFQIVDDGNLSNANRNVDVSQQYYSIYIRTIVERILTEAGFGYSGSMFDDYRYLNAFLPFANAKPRRSGDFIIRAYLTNTEDIYFINNGDEKTIRFDDDAVIGTDPTGQWDITPTATSYDFSFCQDQKLNELEAQMETLKKEIEDRKTFLKSIKDFTTFINNETGEVETVYPPIKRSSYGVKVTLK